MYGKIKGTIIEYVNPHSTDVYCGYFVYRVKWDNGCTNVYRIDDLEKCLIVPDKLFKF